MWHFLNTYRLNFLLLFIKPSFMDQEFVVFVRVVKEVDGILCVA